MWNPPSVPLGQDAPQFNRWVKAGGREGAGGKVSQRAGRQAGVWPPDQTVRKQYKTASTAWPTVQNFK